MMFVLFSKVSGSVPIFQQCVSLFVSVRAVRSILHDDRIAKRLDHLDEVVQTELDGVMKLNSSAVVFLASVCGTPVSSMREDIKRSAIIQAGFAESTLRLARSLPWSLCRGDVGANLLALGMGLRPSEPRCGTSWRCSIPLLTLLLVSDCLQSVRGQQHFSSKDILSYPVSFEHILCIHGPHLSFARWSSRLAYFFAEIRPR